MFLSPDARIEDVILDDDMAFRVLVMRDSASPSPEGFDVVYESAREGRFSDRLVAVAAELYRFETLVVVQPELEGGDGTFTERQRALFERELKRLGIRESVVSEQRTRGYGVCARIRLDSGNRFDAARKSTRVHRKYKTKYRVTKLVGVRAR